MMGLKVKFVWIPAHYGVIGNEVADKIAKQAAKGDQVDLNVSISKAEMKSMVKQKTRERWQKQWEEERTGRWFYSIQRKVGEPGEKRQYLDSDLDSSLFIIGKNQMGKCSSKLLNMFCSIVKIIRKREENEFKTWKAFL